MVTRILLDPRRDLPDGSTLASTTVLVEATPTGIREDGSVVVLPTTLPFTITTAADLLQLPATTASWKWRLVVRDPDTRTVLQQRTVLVPDQASIAYADLPDVDPASLGNTPSSARNWDAVFAQLLQVIAQLTNQSLDDVNRWTANTTYQVGTVVLNPDEQFVQANATHTSGSSYDPSKWTIQTLNLAGVQALIAQQAAQDANTYVSKPGSGDPTGSVPTKQSDGTVVYVVPPTGGGGSGAVSSVAGRTGAVTLAKTDVGLSNVDNTADAAKPVSTATATALAGKADLIGGLIPSSQIPSIALVHAVPVANQAAMLALTTSQVQPGDVAVRQDGAGSFMLNAADPSQLGSWVLLASPSDAVSSVNGHTGAVVLSASDVAADPAGAATAAQAYAIQRSNHAGTQPASTITGLATVATTGAYSDITGRPTISGTNTGDQTISLTGSTLTLSAGGGTVTLPSSGGGGQTVYTYDVRNLTNGNTLDPTGTNDSSSALQYAINQASAQTAFTGPVVLFVPNGSYKLTTGLQPKNNVKILGESRAATVFLPYNSETAFKLIGNLTTQLTGFGLENLTIDGANQTSGSYTTGIKGIFVQFAKRLSFHRVTIKNTWATGFGCDFLQETQIIDCWADNCGRGITATGSSRDTALGGSGFGIGTGAYDVEDTLILGSRATNNGVHGIFFERQTSATIGQAPVASKGIRVIGCYSSGNWYGFRDAGIAYAQVVGNEFIQNLKVGAAIDATSLSTVGGSHGDLSNNTIAENGAGQAVTTVTGGVIIGNATGGNYTIRANRIYANTGMGVRGFAGSGSTYIGPNVTITDNDVYANTRAGIYIGYSTVSDPVVDLTIALNRIRGNGTDGTTTAQDAIHIEAGTTRLRVISNVTAGPGYGLLLGTSTSRTHTDLAQTGNDFRQSSAGQVSDTQTAAGTTIRQNLGDAVTVSGTNPAGGTTGQVLTKNSATDYDYSWATPATGGGSGGTAGPGTILGWYTLAATITPANASTATDLDGTTVSVVVPASGKLKFRFTGTTFSSASSTTTGQQLFVFDTVSGNYLGPGAITLTTTTAKIGTTADWVVTGLTPGATITAKLRYTNNPAGSTLTIQNGQFEVVQL